MAAIASSIEAISDILKESMSTELDEALTKTEPIFTLADKASFGVERDMTGRGWAAHHTLVTSLAGSYGYVSASGDAPNSAYQAAGAATGSASTKAQNIINAYTPAAGFPGAAVSPMAGIVRKQITLSMATGNIFFPLTVLQGESQSASIVDWTATNMQLTAKNAANARAANFYKVNTADAIAVISSVSGSGTGRYTITLSDGRTNVFQPGMFIDSYNPTGPALRNTAAHIAIMAVDPDLTGTKIIVQGTAISGGAAYDLDGNSVLNAGDYIVLRGSQAYGADGLEDWMLGADGQTIYGIPLTDYPQLKSFLTTSVGSLTERKLRKYLGAFNDKMAGWVDLDTIITTGGVTREYLNSVEDLGQFQRQGAALNFEGGFASVGFTYDNTKFKWLVSRYCKPQTMYAIKTSDNNLKRYVPPKVSGAGSHSAMDGDVQFIAGLGAGSVFLNSRNSSGEVLQYIEAPFYQYEQFAMRWPQGVKLTGLTED